MYAAIVTRAQAEGALAHLFPSTGLTHGCVVREMPADDRAGGPLAYYVDNCFYVNTNYDHPVHQAEALAFHEAVPGHHLQANVEDQYGHLPAYRFFAPHTDFVEGWAVLAEGLLPPVLPGGARGVVESERFRAVRQVVDTGIHHLHWTLDEARDYMRAHGSISPSETEAELVRYVCEPGQALGYYSGLAVLRDVRTVLPPGGLEEILRRGSVPSRMLVRRYLKGI